MAIIGVAVMVVLVGGLIAAVWYHESVEREARAAVIAEVRYHGGKCKGDDEYPLELTVTNGSSRILKRARIPIQIYQPGRSENLAHTLATDLTWDTVLRPNEQRSLCATMPRLSRTVEDQQRLIFKAVPWDVGFFSDGEFVP